MQVPAFLGETYVVPISDKQLMAAVAWVDAWRVHLIAIAQDHSMKTATKEDRGGNSGTVCRAYIKHLVAIVVYKPARDVTTPSGAVCTEK